MGKPEAKETEVQLTKGLVILRDDVDKPGHFWLIAKEGKRSGDGAFCTITPADARHLSTVLRVWADEHGPA